MDWTLFFLRLLPKCLVSYLTGVLVRISFPEPVASWTNKAFVKAFGIDMSEAEKELHEYENIEAVFSRKLKPSARPLCKEAYCSPCDGVLSLTQNLQPEEKVALQIKGFSYSLEKLVFGGGAIKSDFDPAWVNTFYLAPHNYHRVHAPLSGSLVSIRHIPGNLWPVNPKFLNKIPRLFVQNERLVFEMKTPGGGHLYLVMVGALNVGRILTPFSKKIITNNRLMGKGNVFETLEPPISVEKGQEMGSFLMGSTVVLVFDKKALEELPTRPIEVDLKKEVRMGENLLI